MDVQTMDDDIGNILNCDAASISNVDIGTTAINGLEAVDNELLLQLNDHVTLENNPEGPVLNNSVTEGAGLGVDRVVITGVSDHVEATITATDGVSSKTNATVSKAFAVLVPVAVTAPAVINGITSSTSEVA